MNLINDLLSIKPVNTSENTSALISALGDAKINENEIIRRLVKEMQTSEQDQKLTERKNYILSWHEKLYSQLSDSEIKFVLNSISRLISARFSGKAQPNLAIDIAINKLIYAVKNKTPIKFIFGFGGYKNHNSPSSPQVDLAELFQMNYLVNYLLPIIQSYQYGVEIIYESEEVSIQFNNVPQENTDKYTHGFRLLIDAFIKRFYQLNGIKLNISLVMAREMYSEDELKEKMALYRPQIKTIYDALSDEEKDIWHKRAETNFMIYGTQDYSDKSPKELNEIITDARITNECFLMADYELRQDFFEQPNSICIFGTWGKMPSASSIDGGFHIKSTRFSNTDFWIGTGTFHITGDAVRDEILSTNQYKEIAGNINFENLQDPDFNNISRNFEKIRILKS